MPVPAYAAHTAAWWARWKRLAHRAAEIQAHVLLFLLYVLVVTPIGFLRRVAVRDIPASGWQKRPVPVENTPMDEVPRSAEARLQEARRQF